MFFFSFFFLETPTTTSSYINTAAYIVNWVREIKNPSDSKYEWRKNLLISTQTTGEKKTEHKNDEMVKLCVNLLYKRFRFIFRYSKGCCYKTKAIQTIECDRMGKKGEKNWGTWTYTRCTMYNNNNNISSLFQLSNPFQSVSTFYQIEHRQQCSKEFGFILLRQMKFTFSSNKVKEICIETTTLLIRCN